MKIKMLFTPLVFLGTLILSLVAVVPAFSATGTVRFYSSYPYYTYEDKEWARQGGSSSEQHTLSNERTFFLEAIPIADKNSDGFVNRNDVTVVDASGDNLAIDRVSADGRVDLVSPHTGTVFVSYVAMDVNGNVHNIGGGQIGLEVSDPDLDIISKMEGVSSEQHTFSNVNSFFLRNVSVVDRNDDGFVNERDVSIEDAVGNPIEVDRVYIDGRVDLVIPYTGTVFVSYWADGINDTGDKVRVKSQADPVGFIVTLKETSRTSGVFRWVIDTNAARSDADSIPPSLKVGKDDIITLTYMDLDPPQTISKRLYVETTPPTFSNISPVHGSSYTADTEIQFDVTDGDSGVDYGDIWIIFAVDQDSDGVIESAYERDPSRYSTIHDGMRASRLLPDDSEIDLGATIYWWALAQDGAGNLAVLDRQSSLDGRNDPCSPGDFPRTSLAGVDVGRTGQVAGCQPYAVRIDYTGPYIERIVTGHWWDASKSGDDKTEYDLTKARNDSILVDFSEEMDASTIQRFDFEVDGRVPLKAEVFSGRKDYVFLTVSELAANARPTVEVIGEIRDTSGNRYRAEDNRPTPQPTPAPTPSISSLGLFIRVLREAGSLGVLSDQIADLLSDWFIANMIAPNTGETPDEVRERLSAE